MRLIKGSHIVVRRRFEHEDGYLLQAADGRVVFVLPFAQDFTLIGTTDENFVGDINMPTPDAAEVLYLCETVNEYFRDRISPDELVWSFAGVRALYDDGAGKPEDVTRDYVLRLDAPFREAPLLTVYGGKITTHRKLAEAAMARIGPYFQAQPRWTANVPLPGGEFPPEDFYEVVASAIAQLAVSLRAARQAAGARLWPPARAHPRRGQSMDDLGECFVGDLTAAEVRYLVENEWAQTAEDVLWRRSKLGLTATDPSATPSGAI